MNPMRPLVEIENVSKTFTLHLREGTRLDVVSNVSLQAHAGECLVLGGPSGAGKSSLLKMIYGNYRCDYGAIRVGGTDVASASPREIMALRKTVMGYVSQFLRVIPRVGSREIIAARGRESGLSAEIAQERAVTLEQQRDDAIGRSEALSEQLGELSNLVQLSVEDLATLEERLAELAGEKAQAEDRATLTQDELRTLAERVDSAVRQLNACADDLFALQSATIDAYNSIARGTPVDVGPLNQRLAEMTERCSTARRAGESAVALASRLR
jgi:ABC-type glutathione transport system ATPase component